MSDMTPWAQQHEVAWLATLATLRSEGWQAELTCFAAPVQVEGNLPTGEPFIFHARHNEASLAIGGDDPADMPDWEHGEEHDDASYLTGDEGLSIMRRLARRYADSASAK